MNDLALDAQARDWAGLHAPFRWNLPARYNIAQACCGRWAAERSRFALYYEDAAGHEQAWTFWDIQQDANRLSNVLGAMGTLAGDRIAIMLPQRPETAIAHMACYQMGAIALPVSHLFGAEALEYRLAHAEACIAIVDAAGLATLATVRERLPGLRHVICVGGRVGDRIGDCIGDYGAWARAWTALLPLASSRYTPRDTAADDPAVLIYTSGTTGNPKGALMAQRTLLGNLPGFVCSHDFYPRRGDLFWSPADWAWTGGLFDALLPAWSFGQPILAYDGRFDPEKACWLMQKYGVRNAFLFPTALKRMMQAVPHPRSSHDLQLRTLMSGGEAVGAAVFEWAQEELGVRINEIFGQTEINYVVGGCASVYAPTPGAMGRPYPGHEVAILDEAGQPLPPGEVGEVCVRRGWQGALDPVFFLGYWRDEAATRAKFFGDPADPTAWGRTGDQALMDDEGVLWYRGRNDDMINSAGYRIGPTEIENCLLRHPAVANAAVIGVPDALRGEVVKAFIVPREGEVPSATLAAALQAHVGRYLAPYETPKIVSFIDSLPLTATGKVQRRLLRLRGEDAGKKQDDWL